jgi:hypothetical protein
MVVVDRSLLEQAYAKYQERAKAREIPKSLIVPLKRIKNVLYKNEIMQHLFMMPENEYQIVPILAYLQYKENKQYLLPFPEIDAVIRKLMPEIKQAVKTSKGEVTLPEAVAAVAAAAAALFAENQRLSADMVAEILKGVVEDRGFSHQGTKFSDINSLVELVSEARRRIQLRTQLYVPPLPPQVKRLERLAETLLRYVVEAAASTRPFGPVTGVRNIRSISEVKDLTPQERAILYYGNVRPELKALGIYRILSGQAQVFERTVRSQPYIFIDTSGSMKGVIRIGDIEMAAIDAARAIASAFLKVFKKPTIYMFDTELFNLRSICGEDKNCLYAALWSIPGGGGTNITNVLTHILQLEKQAKKRREKPFYVIITDAGDRVDPGIIKEIKKNKSLWSRTLIVYIGDPTMIERHLKWVKMFRYVTITPRQGVSIKKLLTKLAEVTASAATAPA